MSCDISYAFCTIVFVHSGRSADPLLDIFRGKFSPILQLDSAKGSLLLQEKNIPLLSLGVLKFLVRHQWNLSLDEYDVVHKKIKELIPALLFRNEMNLLLRISDSWLSLIALQNQISPETCSDAYKSVNAVVILHWNHHIGEFRRRVTDLLLKCLSLNYSRNIRMAQCDKLFLIVQMETFRAFAYDMFWTVPFKYFAYAVGLKFVSQVYSVSKVFRFLSFKVRV